MRVRVLYFASAREAAGCAEETLDAREGATVAEVKAAIGARHPRLASRWSSTRVALGERFATDASRLAEGDVVALIPPVAGG